MIAAKKKKKEAEGSNPKAAEGSTAIFIEIGENATVPAKRKKQNEHVAFCQLPSFSVS